MLPFHDAGAAGRDLTWNFKSLSQGEDYPVCLSFPKTTDFANNLKIITTGSNIYGTESTDVDKLLAVTGLILFGVNNIKYIAKPIINSPICERIFSYAENY